MSKEKRVALVIAKVMEDIRSADRQICEEAGVTYRDPLADCQILVKLEEKVTLTFDGAGYDYFSCEAWHNYDGRWFNMFEKNRAMIEEGIKKIDPELYIEDNNSWSFSIWMK